MLKKKILIKLLISDVWFFLKNIIHCDIEIQKLQYMGVGHMESYSLAEGCVEINRNMAEYDATELKAIKKHLKKACD